MLGGKVTAIDASRATVAASDEVRFTLPADGLSVGDAVDVAIRADKITPARADGIPGEPMGDAATVTSTADGVRGRIASIEYLGLWVRVRLAFPGNDDFRISLPDTRFFADSLAVGDEITATWSPSDLHRLGAER